MRVIKNISYSLISDEFHLLDLYLPETKAFSTMIYIHGGGIEGGSKNEDAKIVDIVAQNIALVQVNYRLYPNAVYPEFINDVAEAVAWVKENIGQYGECSDIFIGGSSAGAYLSMMLYFDPQYLNRFGLSPKDFSGYIFDAGQPTTHFNVLRERGLDTRKIIVDEAAPLFHIDEYENTPPMLIFVADNDIENRYEQTQLLLSTLKYFHYPEDLVEYRYMEGFTHCEYNGDEIFPKIISDFILRRQKI